MARHIVDIVEERKAEDIVLLDLRPDQVIADFFVICNGDNERHLRALEGYVRDEVKREHQVKPYSVDGNPESGWIVLDYGDVVVHIFSEIQRHFYDIEEFWSHDSKVMLSIQ